LAEVPSGERLILFPQPRGHLAHGGPAQEAGPRRVAEGRLDVPGAQAAGEHLDGELLELGGAPGQARAHPRAEGLGAVRDLGHAILDGPFGRLQPAAPVAIAMAGPRRRPLLVVATAEGGVYLSLQG